MWNVIHPAMSIFKSTDPIDIALLISNIKLADLAVFLFSWTELLSYYNAFSWLIPFVD